MVQGISSNMSAYSVAGNSAQKIVSSSQKKEDETSEVEASSADVTVAKMLQSEDAAIVSKSIDGDTVTISAEGMKAMQASAASAVTATAETSTDSTSSTSDLSDYSESELKQMLSKGEITQAEYNAEIASRQLSTMEAETESGESASQATELSVSDLLQ